MKFRFPILATIVTLLAFVTMMSLGYWQLDRAESKQQRLQQIQTKTELAAMNIDEITQLEDIRDLPVTASGQFSSQVFLVDNKIYQGQVGYQAIAILQLYQGNLLVNLGWIKAPNYRQELPLIELPKGVVTIEGIVSIPTQNPMVKETAFADDNWPKVIQQIDIARMTSMLSANNLLGWVMLLNPDTEFGYARDWQPVVMPPEKHYAYAVQWFALALASLVVYAVAIFKRRKETLEEPR